MFSIQMISCGKQPSLDVRHFYVFINKRKTEGFISHSGCNMYRGSNAFGQFYAFEKCLMLLSSVWRGNNKPKCNKIARPELELATVLLACELWFISRLADIVTIVTGWRVYPFDEIKRQWTRENLWICEINALSLFHRSGFSLPTSLSTWLRLNLNQDGYF